MSAVALVSFGAVSSLGEQTSAFGCEGVGSAAKVALARDPALAEAGLVRPFAGRALSVSSRSESRGDGCRATALLDRALTLCAAELDRGRPGWRGERVGLIVGTSSGAMREAVRAFDAGGVGFDLDAVAYYGPLARAARRLGVVVEPSLLVLGACASSTLAIGLSLRALAQRRCDLVLAGGFDDVSVFVAAGFEALRATTAQLPPRPFRFGRDGMALGEGAAVLALARSEGRPAGAWLTGFGAASDAAHLTAPDGAGLGLGRAAQAALAEAGDPKIDLVSAHATATPMNDQAEFRAIERALGPEAARSVVVHAFKSQVGHTLGAGGALELLATVDALDRGLFPASAGIGLLDPLAPARLLAIAASGAPRTALKLTSAFGGSNAALVVARGPLPERLALTAPRTSPPVLIHRGAYERAEASPDWLAARCLLTTSRIARGDGLVRIVLSAVAALEARVGPLAGAAIVVGTVLSTLETNALFAQRMRARGAAAAEPRRFPYTSPNAACGECSIAFGLTGPSFAVGGGLHAGLEALVAATLLVEGGDADRVVVVAADESGPMARALGAGEIASGAVAFLVTSAGAAINARLRSLPGNWSARVASTSIVRGRTVQYPGLPGHQALLSLAAPQSPRELLSTSPPDVTARVALAPV